MHALTIRNITDLIVLVESGCLRPALSIDCSQLKIQHSCASQWVRDEALQTHNMEFGIYAGSMPWSACA